MFHTHSDILDTPAMKRWQDVVLVFKNAMTYNGEKSQIYEDAAEGLKAFEADLAQVPIYTINLYSQP